MSDIVQNQFQRPEVLYFQIHKARFPEPVSFAVWLFFPSRLRRWEVHLRLAPVGQANSLLE